MTRIPALALVLALLASATMAQAAGHSVTLTWTASTDTGSSYIIFRAAGACPTTGTTGLSQLATVATGVLTFTDTAVTAGTYCYGVEASLAGSVSGMSNLVNPQIKPGTVTVTVTVAQ